MNATAAVGDGAQYGEGARTAGPPPYNVYMPRALTERERQEFLGEPHISVLSVASDAGRPPHSLPTWYGYEPGGNLSFFTGTQGRKARKTELIERAGVVSFAVQREKAPYRYVTVEGTVVRADRPPALEQMLAIVRRYLPEEQAQGFVLSELANPGPDLVLFTIRPDRWLTADFSE